MKPVPIHKAKTELSRLIEKACAGEEIIICRGKQPVVRLVPIEQTPRERKFGALLGKLIVDPSFLEPLPEVAIGDREIEWVSGTHRARTRAAPRGRRSAALPGSAAPCR
jgi:prevent-host-death family protein